MKGLLALAFFASSMALARPIVLVSYYDAFGSADFNNSERVAKALSARANKSVVDLRYCALSTVFDKSYAQLDECIRALPRAPLLVIGLGEGSCGLKIETATRNFDKTIGPDNESKERQGPVIPGAPEIIGMRIPLSQMYCALGPKERDNVEISNNAGSFVCNNTAFQLNYFYPELMSGFIHVPAHKCWRLEKKNAFVVSALATMIERAVEYLQTEFLISPMTPHTSNDLRLPFLRDDIYDLKKSFHKKDCQYEFFKRAPGVDERAF